MSVASVSEVGAYEAKTRFSELLQRASEGEEITITRHGAPIAKLGPVTKIKTVESRSQAIDELEELAKGRRLGGLKIKDLIAEGRR